MRIHLHIGTPKSGTTYLQALLGHNKQRLAEAGVLWPGRDWPDQVKAVRDVLDVDPHRHRPPDVEGSWDRMVAEILQWRGGDAVLSMEWLVHATPEQVERIVGSFQPHEVRVIATVRDVARTIPAQWQEQVQNWATWTWGEYLAAVTSEAPRETAAGRQLFDQYDLGAILRNWRPTVPVGRITVVTVPPPGAAPDELWERFAEALGVPPDAVDPEVPVANESIGAASAELMRRINVATREEGIGWDVGDPVLKWALAKNTLSHRRSREPKVHLPAEHQGWAERESRRLVADLRSLGVPVVGSLDDLRPRPVPASPPDPVTPEQMLDAAVDGIVGLTRHIGDVYQQRRGAVVRAEEAEKALAAATAPLRYRLRARAARDLRRARSVAGRLRRRGADAVSGARGR